MSSIYWADLPFWLEDSSKKLKIPPTLILGILEFIASQIFGMLLYVINLNVSELIHKSVPTVFQIILNYVLFKVIQYGVSRFEITPLPIFTNKNHERFIKTVLLPSAGIVLMLSGAGIALAVANQYSIGIAVRWIPFFYSFVANCFFLLFTDQFARVGKSSQFYLIHLSGAVLLIIATVLTTGIFYYYQ